VSLWHDSWGDLTNRFLGALPKADQRELLTAGSEVDLPGKFVIAEPGKEITNVYFPLTLVASIITTMDDGRTVEAATVGNEGFVPLEGMFVAADEVPSRCIVQVPGEAVVVPLDAFQETLKRSSTRERADRYAHAYMAMMAQNVACIRLHPIEQRCARWVLMTHDRATSDRFSLTQEFLADMLGVTRPSVTVVAQLLQRAGFIEYRRGVITVTDREGLEDSTCECYHVLREHFRRALDTSA
jgi:CRP-like cAMP-binding protein